MSGSPILGMRGTSDYVNNIVQWDWADVVAQYDIHGELPLTALMSRVQATPTDSTRVEWFDKDYESRVLELASGAAGAVAGDTTTLTVKGGAYYAVATMMIHVPSTGEYMRVTADPSSATQFTVSRGWNLPRGTSVAPIANGAFLTLVGTAAEEGSGVPTPVNTDPFELYNLTQIFKTPYTITNTDAVVNHRTGDPWVEASAQAAIRHMKDIEHAMFFGQRSKSIGAGGKEIRTMGGLDFFIKSNRDDFGGTGTLDKLEDFYGAVAMYGNRTILTMCGDNFVTRVNRLVRNASNYVMQAPEKIFGYDVLTIVMPNGITLKMITHPLLNAHPYWRNSGWSLSLPDIVRRPLRSRDTKVEKDIISSGTDAKGEQLLTEMTMMIRREKNFGVLLNV